MALSCCTLIAHPAAALEDGAGVSSAQATLVVTAPLDRRGLDADRLSGQSIGLDGDELRPGDPTSVQGALGRRLPGVSLSDSQGNAFTEALDYRGFAASPLQGQAQGLAVYQNGVRINEAFGDTVNWDLIPEVAVDRIELVTSNPAFGLNALGGAVSVRMKDGFGAEGGSAALWGGSFDRLFGSAEVSHQWGNWSAYLAGDGGGESGWRPQSASRVLRLYGDLGYRGKRLELHLTGALSRNRFGVVGPTPADLLAQDRQAIFTSPQETRNRAYQVALNGRFEAGSGWTLSGNLYLRSFSQTHVDGNGADLGGCSDDPDDPLYGQLCVDAEGFPDDLGPAPADLQVFGPDGQAIACPATESADDTPCEGVPYGTIDRTRTRATTGGGSVEARWSGQLAGRRNDFVAGASFDYSSVRFSADSTLGLINPDLSVTGDPHLPGGGLVIHSAGAITYSPTELRDGLDYVGLYAADTADLTDRLSLTGSARFNSAHIALADLTGTAPQLDGAHDFRRLNLAAGLAWRLGGGASVFGGWSEANRAPTALELGCSDPVKPCLLEGALVADPPLKQVTAQTWQGGLRGRNKLAGGQLSWSGSLFDADSHNDILSLASVVQGRGYFANIPLTRRRGFELFGRFAAPRFSAYASYAYVAATSGFSGLLPSANNPSADENGNVEVHRGDRIGGIPAGRLKLGASLDLTRRLSVGASLAAVSSQYLVGDEANQNARLPAYRLVDVQGSWKVTPAVELFGRIENLFDSRAATYGTYFETDALEDLSPSPLPAPDRTDPRTLTLMAPRSIEAGLRLRW